MARLNDHKVLGTVTAKANAATTETFLAVTFNSDEAKFNLASAGDRAFGVVREIAAADEEKSIVVAGIVPVRLGATVADGAFVAPTGSAGRVATATGLAPILGWMPVGGASGEVRSVWLGVYPNAPIVGADVASAATITPTGQVQNVTGTTNVTDMTSTGIADGAVLHLRFTGVLTFTAGNKLVIAGNLVTTADDTITLMYRSATDKFYELARSVNA